MKNYKKLLCVIVSLVLIGSNSSCEKWLRVDTGDRIMEDKLYESPDGFLVALNGVYIEFISFFQSSLSNNDILAQYWDLENLENQYNKLGKFEPQTKHVSYQSIWEGAYKLLNNTNTIIEHCDADKAILSEKQYGVFKGEALAMRALLHFEIFKIFCPSYAEDKDGKYMPYATSSDLIVVPYSSSSEIASFIMKDLRESELLLKTTDPIIEEGPLASIDEEYGNALRFRNFRLNYYAVKSLIARTSLYFGDTATALTYASEVIDSVQVKNQYFPFIKKNMILIEDMPDRVFSSEIIFGLYNLKRSKDIFDGYYNASNKNKDNVISLSTKAKTDLYDNLSSDNRLQAQWEQRKSQDNEDLECFIKYERAKKYDSKLNPLDFQFYVPIIKISELYLIKAECLAVSDPTEAYKAINAIRIARNVPDLTPNQGKTAMYNIQREFAREFIGEGQMFWFYKRLNYKSIPHYGLGMTGEEYKTVATDGEQFKFAIPKSESDSRN